MEYLFTFIVSLVVTMLLVPPLIKLAPGIGAIDIPDERKVHKSAIPRIGGIAMIVGAIVPIVFWLPLNKEIMALLASFLILLVFGIWDDRSNLNYKIKFAGQILAVILVVVYGDVVVYRLPFIDTPLPSYLAIPFTVFALVGITNAINLSDGLDGLAGGTSLLTLSMIAFLAYKSQSVELVLICFAVVGGILGFLRHNTYPARIFMGDTGSQFLGFSAGVLVIVLSQQVNQAMSPVVPLILLGLPVLDTIAVIGQRIYEKRSPFSPDKNHIHHKLLDIGFDHYEAVFIIYLVQTGLIFIAYFMRYESDAVIFFIYLVFSFSALFLFHFARNTGWKVHQYTHRDSRLKKWVMWASRNGVLEKWATTILKVGIPVFFMLSVAKIGSIERDMAILSGLLLLFVVLSLFFKIHFLEKIVVYVVCAQSVYYLEASITNFSEYNDILNIYLVLLAVAFAIKIRFSKDNTFQITPLDFLVVLLIIVVPNMPEITLNEIDIGVASFKLIVLFYACEAVLNMVTRQLDIFRIGLVSTLILTIIRGIY